MNKDAIIMIFLGMVIADPYNIFTTTNHRPLECDTLPLTSRMRVHNNVLVTQQ